MRKGGSGEDRKVLTATTPRKPEGNGPGGGDLRARPQAAGRSVPGGTWGTRPRT